MEKLIKFVPGPVLCLAVFLLWTLLLELAVVFGYGETVAGRPRALIPTRTRVGLRRKLQWFALRLVKQWFILEFLTMVVPLPQVERMQLGAALKAPPTTPNSDPGRRLLLTI